MEALNKYIFENMINRSFAVTLKLLETLAFYVMIDATDCDKPLNETKRKLELILRSHVTYILRECPDIAKKYDYKTIFNKKSIDEANDLLDIIISEIEIRKK